MRGIRATLTLQKDIKVWLKNSIIKKSCYCVFVLNRYHKNFSLLISKERVINFWKKIEFIIEISSISTSPQETEINRNGYFGVIFILLRVKNFFGLKYLDRRTLIIFFVTKLCFHRNGFMFWGERYASSATCGSMTSSP